MKDWDLVNVWTQRMKLMKLLSYIATVACFSSPALHRISAAARTRHFLLVVLEGLKLLRTRRHLREKQLVQGIYTVNN